MNGRVDEQFVTSGSMTSTNHRQAPESAKTDEEMAGCPRGVCPNAPLLKPRNL